MTSGETPPELFLAEISNGFDILDNALFPDEASAVAWASMNVGNDQAWVTVMRGPDLIRTIRVPPQG